MLRFKRPRNILRGVIKPGECGSPSSSDALWRWPNDSAKIAGPTHPFPSMFIMLHGKAQAKIGGKDFTFPANEMMFVPAGVTHEFWNPYDEPAKMILLMFGEGA